MKRHLFFLTLFGVMLCPGYLISTGGYYIVGNNGDTALLPVSPLCENRASRELTEQHVKNRKELSPDRFSLLSWNSYKGAKPGWLEQFTSLSLKSDLITLQEGYLNDSLAETLNEKSYSWDIASAFTLDTIPTGVLTASNVKPASICATWDNEPILTLPKTAMITEYRIQNRTETLLLVNVHMVNFTLGTGSFSAQLNKIEQIIQQHSGPVILAGDFNTWSQTRLALLQELTSRTDLRPISFESDFRSRFFGNAVDHIYSRELMVLEAHTLETDSSDHNPLMATFAYPQPLVATNDSAVSPSL